MKVTRYQLRNFISQVLVEGTDFITAEKEEYYGPGRTPIWIRQVKKIVGPCERFLVVGAGGTDNLIKRVEDQDETGTEVGEGAFYISGYQMKLVSEDAVIRAKEELKRLTKARIVNFVKVTRSAIPGFDGIGIQGSMPTTVDAYELVY